MAALPVFGFLQVYLVNLTLSSGRVALSVPIYMTSSIVATMVSGAVIFDDLRDRKEPLSLAAIVISLTCTLLGIFMLIGKWATLPVCYVHG